MDIGSMLQKVQSVAQDVGNTAQMATMGYNAIKNFNPGNILHALIND
jgi:hypothetical protein